MDFNPNNPFHYAYVICGAIFLFNLMASFAVGREKSLKIMLPFYLFVIFIGTPIVFFLTGGLLVFAIPQLLFTYFILGIAIWLGTGFGGHFYKSASLLSADVKKLLSDKRCAATKLSRGYSLNEPDGNSRHFSTLGELIDYVQENW